MIETLFNLIWKIIKKVPGIKERLYSFYAWRIFEFLPFLKNIIYAFYDKFWFIELSINEKTVKSSRIQSDNYELELSRLNYASLVDYKKNHDWDLSKNLIKIEESDVYNFVLKHLSEKKNWQKIDEYQAILNNISKYHQHTLFTNEVALLKYLNNLDGLYSKLKESPPIITNNRIKVGIGRNGDYILLDDIFNIAYMKILNIRISPIQVEMRHPDWVSFCEAFIRFQSIHGELYQPLTHPDLNLKSTYSDKRFEIMKDNLSIHKGKLLDIGANLGYFCHKFEDLGLKCYAVEIRPSNVYFMRKLRDIEGKKFKIINNSLFELKGKQIFDIVIALNIFHHFLRERKLYQQLIKFLERLHVKEMFFQPHNPREKIMQNAYRNYSNQEFVDFIINHSCLNKFKILAESPEGKGRPLYKLYQ